MSTAVAATTLRVNPLRRLTWRRPEWPWALLAAGAWVVLILGVALPDPSAPATDAPMHHHMGHAVSMEAPAAGPHSHHHADLSAAGLGWWMLMTVAMMVPAALPVLREISLQSLWKRRYRSAATFLAGYLAVWGAFGAVALGIWSLAGTPPSAATLVAGAALLVAAAWGLTGAKRRCLKRCHRYVPLAPRGRAGDRAGLHFGLYNGSQCVAVCWPVMLAMVPGHALLAMLGVTMLVTWERLARLPRLRVGALVLAVAASLTLLAGA